MRLTSLPKVGPVTAQKIVNTLGPDWASIEQVLCLPEKQAIAQLSKVPMIGKATAKKIKAYWDSNQGRQGGEAWSDNSVHTWFLRGVATGGKIVWYFVAW